MNKRAKVSPEAGLQVTVGQPWTISNSVVAEGLHIYPMLWRLRDGTLLLDYHIDPDIDAARRACLRSVDNGKTWTPDPPRVHREEAMVQLRDGTVLAYDPRTYAEAPGSKQSKGVVFRSRDGGKTFEGPIAVTVNMPKACVLPGPDADGRPYGTPGYTYGASGIGGELCFWREGLQLPDGSVLATPSAWFEGDSRDRCIAVISKDQGLTFDYLSTVAYDLEPVMTFDYLSKTGWDQDPELGEARRGGYAESALSWTSAGDILCMMRTGHLTPLHQARSSDHGRTWSKPISVNVCSVDPDFVLMSNGVLACSYGRPGDYIMFDPTGTGREWQEPIQVLGYGGLTGYTGIREIAPGKLLFVYDDTGFDDASGQAANCLRAVEITVERLGGRRDPRQGKGIG